MSSRSLLPLLGLVVLIWPGSSAWAQASGLKLSMPLACQAGRDCVVQNYVDTDPGPQARDYKCGGQTYQGHNGVDFRVPDMPAQRRGVPVLAVADGVVLRVRDSAPDISIRAAGAPSVAGQECGNGLVIEHLEGWESQYCHMARGSLAVKAGQKVKAGAILGRVGLSGMTEFPHLHLTVRRHKQIIDPFGPDQKSGTCSPLAGPGLWTDQVAKALVYRAGMVLNFGFSSSEISMDAIEQGQLPPPRSEQPFLFAYVRALHLKAGDIQILTLIGPEGKRLSVAKMPPLDRDKAQMFVSAGMRRPASGWPKGQYKASYQVLRDGTEVLSKSFSADL